MCICFISTSCKYFTNPKVIVVSKYQHDTLFTKEAPSKESIVFTDNVVFTDITVHPTARQIADKTGMSIDEAEVLSNTTGSTQVIVKEKEIPRSTWELIGKWILLIVGIIVVCWILFMLWFASKWK